LGPLLDAHPGLRVPGAWDGFEAAVLAVLGQKLTKPGCRKSVVRLVHLFGKPVNTQIRGLKFLFPSPEVLARADFSKAGIGDSIATVLRKLARATMGKHLTFSTLRTLDQTVSQLGDICGIDESTANYIAMRAFGEPDAFPARELGLRRRFAKGKTLLSSAETEHLADEWRPWRAYAAMYFSQ
jgi:AraC family transcriptional regulator, regulatory protein of adaptative response / DNA-3-methyladenine glycosylase II